MRNNEVQVLGTSFNVNTYDSTEIKVSLATGSIKIKNARESKYLQPGTQAVIREDQSMHTLKYDERELAWKNGVYYFTDMTLADICKIVPRWYGRPIQIDNPDLMQKRFTGRMQRDLPVNQFLETLKATSLLSYHIDNNRLIHLK
jgi:transmembrane sensor